MPEFYPITLFSSMLIARFLQKFFFFIAVFTISGCQTTTENSQNTSQPIRKKTEQISKNLSEKRESKRESGRNSNRDIPEKVYTVLAYVRKYNRAPEGYTGGRKFGNFEKHLPLKDTNSRPMKYREWDVNPKKKGKNRGAERLITSENERAWYT